MGRILNTTRLLAIAGLSLDVIEPIGADPHDFVASTYVGMMTTNAELIAAAHGGA